MNTLCNHPMSNLWPPYEHPMSNLWSTYERPMIALLTTCDHPTIHLWPPYDPPVNNLWPPYDPPVNNLWPPSEHPVWPPYEQPVIYYEQPVTTLWATSDHPMIPLWKTCDHPMIHPWTTCDHPMIHPWPPFEQPLTTLYSSPWWSTHDQTDHLPRVMSAQMGRSYRSPKVHQLDQFLITLNRMKFSYGKWKNQKSHSENCFKCHVYFQQIDAHFWYHQNCGFSPLTLDSNSEMVISKHKPVFLNFAYFRTKVDRIFWKTIRFSICKKFLNAPHLYFQFSR